MPYVLNALQDRFSLLAIFVARMQRVTDLATPVTFTLSDTQTA
jgi:hypothetical protein